MFSNQNNWVNTDRDSNVSRQYQSFEPQKKSLMGAMTMDKQAKRQASWLTLWERRGLKNYLLWPLAQMYRFATWMRRACYRTGVLDVQFAPVPVVIVGGIMVGGVGKTPVVSSLARALREAGYTPGIISRGYGGSNAKHGTVIPVYPTSSSSVVGDEPLLLALNTGCPVWVGADRVAATRALCTAHPEVDVILCDDGLQHYRLARDIEIVVMDQRGIGNGWCMPAGPLRESATRLKEADVVVCHQRGGLVVEQDAITQMGVPTVTVESYLGDAYDLLNPEDRVPLSFFAGKSVVAAAGIAQPALFFNMLADHHVHAAQLPLPDHASFDKKTLSHSSILRSKYVLMTEKDAVKCQAHVEASPENLGRYWVVPLTVKDSPDLSKLQHFVLSRLAAIHSESGAGLVNPS